MKFAIITNVPESIGRTLVTQEAEVRGHTLDLLRFSFSELSLTYLEETCDTLSVYDVVHFAADLGEYVTQEVQKLLSERNVYCINSYERRVPGSASKIQQMLQFKKHGLPTPKSLRSSSPDFDTLAESLGNTFVMKPPIGSKGADVTLIRTPADLETYCVHDKEYLFQEFISYQADYRVHVIGETTFCAYRRIPPGDDFRANVSLGGTLALPERADVPTMSSLAISAAKSIGYDYCGIDILKTQIGTWVVLEANADPGYKGVVDITGESFAVPIVDYYEQVAWK